MDSFDEWVKVVSPTHENDQLQECLREFYRLQYAPTVTRDVFVTKSSYQRFLNAQMRARTPYSPASTTKLPAAQNPAKAFDVVASKISFIFPSGRTISLTDTLTEPNGLTKTVDLADSDGQSLTYTNYRHAEGEVVQRFLAEMGQDVLAE